MLTLNGFDQLLNYLGWDMDLGNYLVHSDWGSGPCQTSPTLTWSSTLRVGHYPLGLLLLTVVRLVFHITGKESLMCWKGAVALLLAPNVDVHIWYNTMCGCAQWLDTTSPLLLIKLSCWEHNGIGLHMWKKETSLGDLGHRCVAGQLSSDTQVSVLLWTVNGWQS